MTVKIVAHRGYSGRYPEMTTAAFAAALELPIHGVECDIRLSRDGELVCIHDPIVDRVSDGSGRVSTHTLPQLQELNFGAELDPQQVVPLNDLLDMIAQAPGQRHIYIETKHPLRYGRILEEQLLRTLIYHGMVDDQRVHVISFSGASLMRMYQLAPQIDRVYLRRTWTRFLRPLDPSFGHPTALGLSLLRAKMHPDLVGKRGMPTYVFTVDDPEDMQWCRDNRVELMATNEPERALDVLGAAAATP